MAELGHSNEGKSRDSLKPSSVGGGREYVEWLANEPKRRMAALMAESDLQAHASIQSQKFKKPNRD